MKNNSNYKKFWLISKFSLIEIRNSVTTIIRNNPIFLLVVPFAISLYLGIMWILFHYTGLLLSGSGNLPNRLEGFSNAILLSNIIAVAISIIYYLFIVPDNKIPQIILSLPVSRNLLVLQRYGLPYLIEYIVLNSLFLPIFVPLLKVVLIPPYALLVIIIDLAICSLLGLVMSRLYIQSFKMVYYSLIGVTFIGISYIYIPVINQSIVAILSLFLIPTINYVFISPNLFLACLCSLVYLISTWSIFKILLGRIIFMENSSLIQVIRPLHRQPYNSFKEYYINFLKRIIRSKDYSYSFYVVIITYLILIIIGAFLNPLYKNVLYSQLKLIPYIIPLYSMLFYSLDQEIRWLVISSPHGVKVQFKTHLVNCFLALPIISILIAFSTSIASGLPFSLNIAEIIACSVVAYVIGTLGRIKNTNILAFILGMLSYMLIYVLWLATLHYFKISPIYLYIAIIPIGIVALVLSWKNLLSYE